MVIQYWPEHSFDDELKIAQTPADDDVSGWWSAIGRPGLAAIVAATSLANGMTQSAISGIQTAYEDILAAPTLSIDEDAIPRRLFVSTENRTLLSVGANDRVFTPNLGFNDDLEVPEVVREPTTYIIAPGNWAAGTDDLARGTPEEDFWDNPNSPKQWDIRLEKPWFLPDDPTSPKVPSNDSEQLPDIGPFADPSVYIIAPFAWTAGTDEAPNFTVPFRDYEYWIDPNTGTTPLGVIVPPKAYVFQQDDPTQVVAKVIDEELWINPRRLIAYWNKWPRPDWHQDDPAGFLFVAPVLSCVVEPALVGGVGVLPSFTPASLMQAVFTDVCGAPLNTDPIPAPLSGIVCWLRARDLKLTDGAGVSVWPDATGRGNSPVQLVGANQPTFRTNVLNGSGIVRFNGDFLQHLVCDPFAPVLLQPNSIVLVVKPQFNTTIVGTAGVGGAAPLELLGYTLGSFRLQADLVGALIGAPATTNAWHLVVGNFAGVASNLYVDGVQATDRVANDNLGSVSRLIVGKFAADSLTAFRGDIAEVMVLDHALTSLERAQLAVYIAEEYGI